ncbi:MAG TPA: histidine kinase, partial [Rhodospirillaceae bacterium]|nr:histidine kinase [Rhodospirillaceae bacterium]
MAAVSTTKKSKNGLFGLLGGKSALQQENDRLAAILSATPAHYCGWSDEGEIFYSRGFCPLLSLGDVRHFADIQSVLAPGDAATLEGMWQNLSGTGKPFDFSARSKTGSKTFRFKGAPGTMRLLWVEDITRETEAQKIRDTEQKQDIAMLTAAIDHLPASIWLRNDRQDLIWVNETYAETLGISQDEIIAQQREISPPPKAKKKAATFTLLPGREQAAKALTEMKTQNVHAHVITTAGDRLLMNIFEIPLPAHNMTLGVARDITRQEELATELKRFKAVNQELLQQLRTAIGIYDSDQRLEFYNTAFSQLWGLDDGWLNTRPRLSDIMEKLRETRRLPEQADFKKFKQSWLSMFTNLIDPHEDMLHLPDGSALRMLVIPNPLGGMMMTFEDVTSRLELESSYN